MRSKSQERRLKHQLSEEEWDSLTKKQQERVEVFERLRKSHTVESMEAIEELTIKYMIERQKQLMFEEEMKRKDAKCIAKKSPKSK